MIIELRLAALGGSINGRTEKHGDEPVPAFDVNLLGLVLSKDELIEYKKDQTIWDRWFNVRKDGMAEPADPDIEYYALDHVYENCNVTVMHALSDDLFFKFEGCKLVKPKLKPLQTGVTDLRLTMQSLIGENHGLYKWMGKKVRIALEFGDLADREKEKQRKQNPELPLDATKSVGSPEENREAAHQLERDIAAKIEEDRNAKSSRRRRSTSTGDSVN